MTGAPYTEPCPVGCGRARRRGHLACGPCWAEVPPELQRAVRDTWKAYNKALKAQATNPSTDLKAARQAYQEAREAALVAIP